GAPQAKAAKNATSGQAFDEGPPRGFGVHAVYVQSIKGKLCETTSELLIQVEGTLSGIRSGPDELRPPSLETNFYGKRTQKLPHFDHRSDYISVSLRGRQAIQQLVW